MGSKAPQESPCGSLTYKSGSWNLSIDSQVLMFARSITTALHNSHKRGNWVYHWWRSKECRTCHLMKPSWLYVTVKEALISHKRCSSKMIQFGRLTEGCVATHRHLIYKAVCVAEFEIIENPIHSQDLALLRIDGFIREVNCQALHLKLRIESPQMKNKRMNPAMHSRWNSLKNYETTLQLSLSSVQIRTESWSASISPQFPQSRT